MPRFLMTFLLMTQTAYVFAQDAAAPAAGGSPFLKQLPLLLGMFALMYFLLIAPQRKQQKRQAEFLSGIKRGDEIVTSSGIIGTINGLNERVISLEISPGTEIKILKSQVQGLAKSLFSNDNQQQKKK